MVAGLLDERHDRRQPAGLAGQLGQSRIVEPHRDLGREILELVAGEPELREDHELGAAVARLAQSLAMRREVRLGRAEPRRHLRQGDAHGLHDRSIRDTEREPMLGFRSRGRSRSAAGGRPNLATKPSGSDHRAVPRLRLRPPGLAARLIVLALFVASCATEAPPSLSSKPTTASPTPTIAAAPSQGRFVKLSYPADADAPCNQKEPPDADHGPYRGNLKRLQAKDPTTVVFELCRPDVAFLSKIAAPAFAINDTAWLQSHIKAGSQAQPIVTEVNGTGPYRLERWDHGSEISLARNDRYWGTPPRNERVIVRWRDTASQRVVELQNATVDGVDLLDPAGVATVDADVSLEMEPRAGLNTVYLGFNSANAPFDNVQVRQAIAMGIDRQKLVDTFFPPGSETAGYVTPCAIPNGCAGPGWYPYDPVQAKEILTAAGFADGFQTTIHYREATRSNLPGPEAIATEIQTELKANLGIDAKLVVEPEDTFVPDVEAGKVNGIDLMVQSGSWPDITAFLDPQFGSSAIKEFGSPIPDLVKALSDGRSTANPAGRLAAYTKANTIIHDRVPLIPIAHTGSASGFRADVDGASASPLRLERFAWMTPGDRRQLVWLTTNEPPGLYCPDEVDPVATLVCAQLTDSLYAYDPDGASVQPALARSCTPDKALTTWTCKLRTGVRFQNGATLDADDVVMSFAVQWDAENPLHAGRDGDFPYMASWLGGLLNPPPPSP